MLQLCSLFQRLQHRVDTETDQKERAGLKKLNRKLKEVHGELQRHNEVRKAIVESCPAGPVQGSTGRI